MAFTDELSSPIIYLNFGALALSVFALLKLRRLAADGKADGAWVPFLGVIAVGTGLHFLGDIIELPWSPEGVDHVLIHSTLLVAMGVLGFTLMRGE